MSSFVTGQIIEARCRPSAMALLVSGVTTNRTRNSGTR